jgi:hypothetical protein
MRRLLSDELVMIQIETHIVRLSYSSGFRLQELGFSTNNIGEGNRKEYNLDATSPNDRKNISTSLLSRCPLNISSILKMEAVLLPKHRFTSTGLQDVTTQDTV